MKFDRNPTTTDVLNSIDLSDKTVPVTGGSTDLGAESARAFAACGADVTLVARSETKLSDVANKIQSETGRLPETAALELDKPDTIRSLTALQNTQTGCGWLDLGEMRTVVPGTLREQSC